MRMKWILPGDRADRLGKSIKAAAHIYRRSRKPDACGLLMIEGAKTGKANHDADSNTATRRRRWAASNPAPTQT
jgi:hypothetical protein